MTRAGGKAKYGRRGHPSEGCGQIIDKLKRGKGRFANLPMFNQFWRSVRQDCIFGEQTPAFVEKSEYHSVGKFVSLGTKFPTLMRVEKQIFFNDLTAAVLLTGCGFCACRDFAGASGAGRGDLPRIAPKLENMCANFTLKYLALASVYNNFTAA